VYAGGLHHAAQRHQALLTLALGILTAPLTAEAQQATKVHRIGWLSAGEQDPYMEAFLEGMRTLGYVEGQNFVRSTAMRRGSTSGSLPSQPSWSVLRWTS